MDAERVRIWRPDGADRLLLMAGRTTGYAIEPRGDYVFGVVRGQAMRARRGRVRRLVRPGSLVAWDPSQAHGGSAAAGEPWTSRLMLVESGHLEELTGDTETTPLVGAEFPDPVIEDLRLTQAFERLHAALSRPSSRLEREERLAVWLRAVTRRGAPPVRPARDEAALRRARDYLGDRLDRNVGLDELAAAAGIGKFRLIRLCRERTGMTPHALQLAARIRRARRRLESGAGIAETAAACGFADQAHLHRHFRIAVGVTPGDYRRRFGAVRSPDGGIS